MNLLKKGSCMLALVLCFGLLATGCSTVGATDLPRDSLTSSDTEGVPSVVKIGIVNPTSGPLAGFGEGCPWTENLLVDYVNNELGGIYFEDYDKTLPIEIIVYDSQSSPTVASQMAQKLVEEDHVDLLLARHTPETVNPVVAVAERYGVPCVSVDEPVDVWLDSAPYEWTYHAHWEMTDLYALYLSMWQQAGCGAGSKVGFLFPSDADGKLFSSYFGSHLEEDGYVVFNPGQYPTGTTDYSDIIKQFIREDVEVLVGANNTPDFATFWLQAKQMGFDPKSITMAKAYLLESDAMSIGADLVDGCCAEVWWSPDRNDTSALTGMTPTALAQKYLDETQRSITPPMAHKYASMELAIAALQNATSLAPENLRDGLAAVSTETVMGPVDYNESRYSPIALTGGQWQLQADGSVELVIIDNTRYPELPLTGALR